MKTQNVRWCWKCRNVSSTSRPNPRSVKKGFSISIKCVSLRCASFSPCLCSKLEALIQASIRVGEGVNAAFDRHNARIARHVRSASPRCCRAYARWGAVSEVFSPSCVSDPCTVLVAGRFCKSLRAWLLCRFEPEMRWMARLLTVWRWQMLQ
jgi:hypothetical protein